LEHYILPVIALLIALVGVAIGLIKLQRKSIKEDNQENFNQGKMESDIEHIQEELEGFKDRVNEIEEDIQKGHMEYDSVQKQIADLRVAIARLEGSR